MCVVNFSHQQDSNWLFKESIGYVTSQCKWPIRAAKAGHYFGFWFLPIRPLWSELGLPQNFKSPDLKSPSKISLNTTFLLIKAPLQKPTWKPLLKSTKLAFWTKINSGIIFEILRHFIKKGYHTICNLTVIKLKWK